MLRPIDFINLQLAPFNSKMSQVEGRNPKVYLQKGSKSQQSDEDDDLFLFEQQKRMEVIKRNNLNVGLYPQDREQDINSGYQRQQGKGPSQFNRFYGSQTAQMKKQIVKREKALALPQIDQQQLSAKKLRAFNAAKYFQKIKLSYLKQVYNATRQLSQVSEKRNKIAQVLQQQFNYFLSLLPFQLLMRCTQIRTKNPFTIDDKQVLAIFRDVFKQQLLGQFQLIIDYNYTTKKITKQQLIFKFAHFINSKIKRLHFFNIQNFVDESFYNLDFEKNDKRNKKGKKSSKLEDQIKNRIKRHVFQQELQEKEEYVDLNNFQFQLVVKNSSKTKQQIENQVKVTKKRSKRVQQIKKSFMEQSYEIFSLQQNKWKLFTAMEGHFQQIQIDWFKQNVLSGFPIIGFYSMEVLKPVQEYESLFQLRKMRKIVTKDMSMYFCDNWRKLVARRKRVGVRPLMGKVMRFCNFKKPFDILQPSQAFQCQHTDRQIKQMLASTQIPKSNIQFNFSDYFLTPSRVGKYHILSPQSKPIQNTQDFNEQKIYWKDDLVPVCSRMGWIDFSRMVMQGEEPLKKTQNRNKNPIQLYRYEQTKPFTLQMDEHGDFILDPEHNSIYIPPNLQLPPQTCIVQSKIGFICSKHKIKCAKLVQGFIHTGGMRVLPNQIGFIIYQKDKQIILKLYQQRQQLLNRNKESRYDEKIQKMWKELLKYVKLIQRMGGEIAAR